ncbi:MAG: hypothetical protein AAFW81_11660 [Pseudomonadota bacterium]
MYGVKRGIKAPGEFGVVDMSGLALSSAAGIIAALVTDYQQKGEAAALFKINEWVVQFGSLVGFTDIPLWMVVAGVTLVGAGSVFHFQPLTRQGAFAQGFGLLAVLLTMTPPNLASGIQGIDQPLPGFSEATYREAANEARIINAAYSPGGGAFASDARVVLAQADVDAGAMYDVHLRITFPEGLEGEVSTMVRRGTIRGRLHNEDTDETFNLFRTGAGAMVRRDGNTLIFHAGVPARSATAPLWVRIEATGYLIEIRSAEANLDEPLDWQIEMTPSDIPLFIQRLNKSYWF